MNSERSSLMNSGHRAANEAVPQGDRLLNPPILLHFSVALALGLNSRVLNFLVCGTLVARLAWLDPILQAALYACLIAGVLLGLALVIGQGRFFLLGDLRCDWPCERCQDDGWQLPNVCA